MQKNSKKALPPMKLFLMDMDEANKHESIQNVRINLGRILLACSSDKGLCTLERLRLHARVSKLDSS
ncbi:hypothetical protein Glove_205g42 [Diversispora epigaea]|uniref:Uncharacterized protein n=1 Tax=Diversispora epigaea TaxID=1348612 RepID=A0A397ITX6_9GLOM|nr:hypothetical protein Glove_205g42 [Diversispora epigaea]